MADADTRRVSGKATLRCKADPLHEWKVGYVVHADELGNPNMEQLNIFLKKHRVCCPECGHVSYIIIEVSIKAIRY